VAEAATLMGLSERHTFRILSVYRREGAKAIAHGNRGRQPASRTSEAVRQRVITLARTSYAGFNHTHLTETLSRHEGVILACSTVRGILVEAGIPSPKQRRPPHSICSIPRA